MSESYSPRLVVTVDTEEDNWEPSRDDISVENIRHVSAFQERMEKLGVRPTYLVTYQVASVPWAADLLADLHHAGRAEVGAHLHPWNTPPLREPMELHYHLFRNLSPELQREKLSSLFSRIRSELDVQPLSFRSGMWSLSREAVGLLLAEGIEVDTSVLPYMYWHDVPYSPSYVRAPAEPYRLARGGSLQRHHADGELLEVPATAGYTRGLWRLWGPVDRFFRTRPMVPLHVPGILARLGLVERIALTPETTPFEKMLELTASAVRRGLPVLNVFLHSNSLLPGATDYVCTVEEREAMLERMERYLRKVLGKYGAQPGTLSEVARSVSDSSSACNPEGRKGR